MSMCLRTDPSKDLTNGFFVSCFQKIQKSSVETTTAQVDVEGAEMEVEDGSSNKNVESTSKSGEIEDSTSMLSPGSKRKLATDQRKLEQRTLRNKLIPKTKKAKKKHKNNRSVTN